LKFTYEIQEPIKFSLVLLCLNARSCTKTASC